MYVNEKIKFLLDGFKFFLDCINENYVKFFKT